jgi:hypothetical protein
VEETNRGDPRVLRSERPEVGLRDSAAEGIQACGDDGRSDGGNEQVQHRAQLGEKKIE